jgi:hypothetical protein
MIGVALIGGLGNQMSQYAAARAAAERLGCGLAVRGPRLRRRHAIPYLARCLLPSLKGEACVYGEIRHVFPNARQSLTGIAVQANGECYRQRKFRHTAYGNPSGCWTEIKTATVTIVGDVRTAEPG